MMPPERNKQRSSLDGVHRKHKRQPDLRPDHDLPAPKQPVLIREHEPEKIAPDTGKSVSASDLPELTGSDAQADERPAKRRNIKKWLLGILLVLLLLLGGAGATGYTWYQQQLSPVSEDTSQRVRVIIAEGMTPSAIAQLLEDEGVIRNKMAFSIHAKLTGVENRLKAGTYSLQPSLPTTAIISNLVDGKQDTFRITFLPGDTLANNRQKIIDAGFSEDDVDAALNKSYDRTLFASKPVEADLEGYIFGETYEFTAAATPETILNRTFDEFEAFIIENNLSSAYKKQKLTLYQGITLASIIQKEVSGEKDSRQVAQVFFKRLNEGLPLGADATFVYAAKKAGQQPTVDFESRYNTRKYKGLPPGPISVPGVHALLAVANPAQGDFLYFVSGDDGKNYFSRTLNEHEANTRAHCKKNCALF